MMPSTLNSWQESFYNFIHPRLEFCNSQRLIQIRCSVGGISHFLIVFDTPPLSIHGDFCSVYASMKACGNESLLYSQTGFSRQGQQLNKLLLVNRFNSECVY